MESKRFRLDRFISGKLQIPKKQIRPMLAAGRVRVDGIIARDMDQIVDQFSHVVVDDITLQQHSAHYIMLHKPIGVVCATKDEQHTTVMELLPANSPQDLHIVGRLDLNTSGLVLLTNDGHWSRQLMSPTQKIPKQYLVTLKHPLTPAYIEAFTKGFYFEYEDITTLPAELQILGPNRALVTLYEGKYHQIKRMFGRFRNQVMALHRIAVGNIVLDENLQSGQSRPLTKAEQDYF
ncbi:16S rRNA pseudouridine(516) synthase [Shewanella colwelliana]|uniref:Pseudouridine synthase n=1 Tax=Shewanella colwelliana TaxID=23 RepID=A0A1E5IQ76_SHECO|nr:pseudouridine synthase [Shewanella colwelliana]OEG72665.1 16S rRNA pseudouridine(516) synthase [Shewanella colwelliana]